MSYRTVLLGDLVTLQYGKALRGYKGNVAGIPVYGSSGIVGYTNVPLAPGPGVIVARKGTLGCHYSRVPFFVIDTAFFVSPKKTEEIDLLWVYYALKARDFRSLDTGAAVPSLTRDHFYSLEVSLPPLATQRRIAAILGAYDDLIEVNRRRVAVLEEMAQGLFEEWFVRFRFPGHEDVPVVDTPDGLLPEGWEYAPLQDFLVLQRGFDLPKSKRADGEVPVFSASGHHGDHNEYKVSGPGVVTGRSGTIGQVHLVWNDFWPLNTTLYVREFKRAGPAYSFLLLRLMDLEKHASGAAVPTLNRNHVNGISLPAPPPKLAEKFEAIAMEKFRMIRNLQLQNENLAASRDLLSPRLLSGQLSVEAAERQLEDAA